MAISDSAQTMAFPRAALVNDESLLALLASVVDDEAVASIVIGRPVALSGNETSSTVFADEVFAKVAARFDELDVVQFDERLTTRQAQRSLSSAGVKTKDHRERIDSAAAVVMLQHYLDSRRVG